MSAWADLALFTLTFVLSIVWNVEIGVVVSLIISLLMVVHRSSKTRMTILVRSESHLRGPKADIQQGRLPGTDRWKPIDETVDAEDVPGVLVVRIRDNLDFGLCSIRLVLAFDLNYIPFTLANTAQLKGAMTSFFQVAAGLTGFVSNRTAASLRTIRTGWWPPVRGTQYA
jgi:hypothetical protein